MTGAKQKPRPCNAAVCWVASWTGFGDRTPPDSLTCCIEGQELVVWKGLDACCDHVAAQTQLDWNGGRKELLLKGGVQTAHVAQPVWLEVQHLVRLCRCVHLQKAPLAVVWAQQNRHIAGVWNAPCRARAEQGKAGQARQQGRASAGQARQQGRTRQGKARHS